jgi:hypothetical protein
MDICEEMILGGENHLFVSIILLSHNEKHKCRKT